jgi:hypothetical protein
VTWPTAPELIAAALGVTALLMICTHQRGGSTNPQNPPDDGDNP